jgi:thiol-disulfide isomerase/thioredoxin
MKMKKVAIIVATVVALIGLTYYLDKKTRVSSNVSAHGGSSSDKSVGMQAPEVHLKQLDDREVSLSDYSGKVVLVNFWATWCAPCREEIPWLIEMQKKYADKGFTVLGLAMDEEGKSVVAPFVSNEQFLIEGGQKAAMDYPIVLGNDDIANRFGGLFGYPTSILISRNGKIIKRITGEISKQDMSREIESRL